MKRNNLSILLILAVTIIALLAGCVTPKEIEYLQQKKKALNSVDQPSLPEYVLQEKDELYIVISSLDDANAGIFSSSSTSSGSTTTIDPYSASLNSYEVSVDGFIQMPVIGNLYVKGKTLAEVNQMIKESLVQILSQPFITIKLVNRYVSVLGEVHNPGRFTYTQDKLTIYDAIALAGDISVFGNRSEVSLTRNENGKNTIVILDLTSPEILKSSYFYIRPMDIIYVKPLKKRVWGFSEIPVALLLTTVTTALLIYSFIKTL